MINKKNILLIPSLILLVLVTSSYVSSKTIIFNPNTLEIKLSSENESYFQNLSNELEKKLNAINKKKTWNVNLNYIKDVLLEETWISSFSIQKFIPNKINIILKPRDVVAIAVNKDGTTIPLSKDGFILPKGSFTLSPIAPVINQKKIIQNTKLKNNLLKIISKIPDYGTFSLDTIEQINLDKNNLIWFQVGKMKIKVNQEDTKKKVSRVNRTIKYLKTRGIADCVIDADLSQKVLVRLNSPI